MDSLGLFGFFTCHLKHNMLQLHLLVDLGKAILEEKGWQFGNLQCDKNLLPLRMATEQIPDIFVHKFSIAGRVYRRHAGRLPDHLNRMCFRCLCGPVLFAGVDEIVKSSKSR